MPFTRNDHRQIAYINLAALPVFVLTAYLTPVFPSVSIITDAVRDHTTLPLADKLELLHNHTAAMENNGSTPTIPKTLAFTSTTFDLFPALVLAGLLAAAYSAISVSWLAKENNCHVDGVSFDTNTVGTDATAVLIDSLFWVFFAVAHGYVFATLLRTCTDDTLVVFVLTNTCIAWALANRIVQRYTPALMAAGLLAVYVHARAISDVMQRGHDLWLPYILMIAVDAVFILGHTFDEVLTVEVALNCRISFVCAWACLIQAVTVALSQGT